MSILSDYQRRIEKPRIEALESTIAALRQRVDALEIALHTIVGHGNITVERAKRVANEALNAKA